MSARKKQGWINYYRKPFLFIATLIFFWLWIFTDPFYNFTEDTKDLLEGFGVIIMFTGVLGRIVSSFSISGRKNKQVIKTEIYATVRHPLYFFSFIILLGAAIIISRIDLTIFATVVYIACFFPMMKNEEKYLEGLFGEEYIKYKKQTPFFLPNFSKFKAAENDIVINHKLVMRTIYDAFFALLIIPGIEVVEYVRETMF